MSGTCLGVVPIKAGVLAIGLFQITFEGITVGLYIQNGLENESLRFYVDFTLHCLNVLAATLLCAGVGTNTRQMFIPWLLMTVMLPTMFMINLLTSLFFFQFHLAGELIVHDALISLIAFYFCTVVYHLYTMMELKQSDGVFTEENNGTMYGTENIVFTRETAGNPQSLMVLRDAPPSYSSIVAAHKEHLQN